MSTTDAVAFDDERRASAAEALLTRPISADEKPHVEISYKIASECDAAWIALAETMHDQVFPETMSHGGQLVRRDGRNLRPHTKISMRDTLSRELHFWKDSANGPKGIAAPMDVASTIIERVEPDWWHAPTVKQVADVPVVSADGRIITTPGLDRASGVLYVPDPELGTVEIDPDPDVDSVRQARDLLLTELLGDFDFQDDASRANALGLVLLPFVRDYIGDAPTPLHAVNANEPGTGKGTLAEACMVPACGLTLGVSTQTASEDSFKKEITSFLLAGTTAVLIDNIVDQLDSPTLAAALTARRWRDRRLGVSEWLDLPIRCVWLATGNNLSLSRDNARRTVSIELQKRPADYRFRHPDLPAWARSQRSKLVAACLTLVSHWLAGSVAGLDNEGGFRRSDSPVSGSVMLPTFERWSEVIGGILTAADVSGFLGNLTSSDQMDEDTVQTIEFLQRWDQALGNGVIPNSEITRACNPFGELEGFVPYSAQEALKKHTHLGYWLRARRGRNFDGLQVEDGKAPGGERGWRACAF